MHIYVYKIVGSLRAYEVYMIHTLDGSRQALKVPLLIFKDIFIRQRLIALSENSDRCYLHYECK